jgi:hypothetical protein
MSCSHEWLELIEVSGPFLALPVLRETFPQGLEELDALSAKRLRSAYEEWRDAVDSEDSDLERLHDAWIEEVLRTALEVDDALLRRGDRIPSAARVELPGQDFTIVPDVALVDPSRSDALLLPIQVFSPDTDLVASMRFGGLTCSPADLMVTYLRATDFPLGMVTNGERWMVVHAPVGQVSTFASWYARLWGQEPETLRAFVSLLGVRRFFGREQDRLPSLFERSLKHQDEVTDALGEQVRRAVEVLVQALDRADQDRNRELLRDVRPQELYEAGLTVMMRLVFLLAAEERGLLLLGEPRYDSFYAVSTLRMQLRAEDEEILERRRSAWSRLLALFRAVFGGIDHPTLHLPAMGGSLFDPDRFPFLEGRLKGSSWRLHPAAPLPIDDRTVLLLLEAIQTFDGRTLSYRALDVEQIGHVYEGLLERTVTRIQDVSLELDSGAQAKDPRVTLGELESARLEGDDAVVALFVEKTRRSESSIRNALARAVEPRLSARLLTACRGNFALRDRLEPYALLLRTDPWGYPLVHPKGAFVVVMGIDRRETGTHYTPKSLTEKIVEETLTPLVYDGPAQGAPRKSWTLKSPAALLDLKVCDPAMGSGAFLVQACRFLSARLVEAWSVAEAKGNVVDIEGRVHGSGADVEPLPNTAEERAGQARRLVAERCLYGVDLNPLAVELAKLSLWLVTLAKSRPFGFLDHNLRCGDSLLGIDRIDQLITLSMSPGTERQRRLFGHATEAAVQEAVELRLRLRDVPIRDIHDIEAMAALDAEAEAKLRTPEQLADGFIGIVLTSDDEKGLRSQLDMLAIEADRVAAGNRENLAAIVHKAARDLAKDALDGRPRRPFHWPFEFPEVFARANPGFDAVVGNPPFLGNRLWKGTHGPALQRIVEIVLEAAPGKVDLCVAFHRRAAALLRSHGAYGLLATSNIAEGSALSVGLERIAAQGDFFFTRKGLPWPGTASTVVAIVCFWKGTWAGARDCDGADCKRIGPRLQPEIAEGWEPKPLDDALFAFAGVDNSKGLAFVITESNPWFERLRCEPNSLLRPYVTGDDITSSSLTRIERWALDIADLPLEAIAKNWPVAHRFLMEVVKPTRTEEALKSYKGLLDRWWQFWNHRADQMRRLRQQKQCIAFAKAAKYAVCIVAPTDWIYTNMVALVEATREDAHAVCLSSMFQAWLRNYSVRSLGRDNKTMRLSISEALATFPLPDRRVATEAIAAAEEFQTVLVDWSGRNSAGMTDAMNAVHSPKNMESEIRRMRELMERIDAGVAVAYEWSGLDLSHDFREENSPDGGTVVRYGLTGVTRDLVLTKLIALNRSRYQASGSSRNETLRRTAKGSQNRRRSASRAGSFLEDSKTVDPVPVVPRAKKPPTLRSE